MVFYITASRACSRRRCLVLLVGWLSASCGVDSRRLDFLAPDAGDETAMATLLPEPGTSCGIGEAYCATATSRVACNADGSWGEPTACQGACVDGSCVGTCAPESITCVAATQFQRCSESGEWSEILPCPGNACFGERCVGVCVPGARRCASDTEVQICSNAGEWGPTQVCATSCSGLSCADECVAGSSACVSETQVQPCDQGGQWSAPTTCPLACVGSTCGGECIPGARRCAPEAAQPELCSAGGSWQGEAACNGAELCEDGTCTCGGQRAVCDDVCVSLADDPAHCGACSRSCLGGECSEGRCQPVALATGQVTPGSVALSDTHVYFRAGSGDAALIRRVPKAGGPVETIIPALPGLSGPAIGGSQLYFGGNGVSGTAAQRRVLRANLDGSAVSAFSPARSLSIQRLITPGLFVYYTVRDTTLTSVFRAPLLSSGQAGAGDEALFASAPGMLSSMAVISGCLFIVDQTTPRQVLRTCSSTTAPELRYQGAGNVSFRSDQMNDDTYLYLLDEGLGTLRLALDTTAAPELVGSQNPGVPTVDDQALYYFAAQGSAPGPCGSNQSLFRAGKQPGSAAPAALLPPPHACPTPVAVDDDALYWSDETGEVLRLAK